MGSFALVRRRRGAKLGGEGKMEIALSALSIVLQLAAAVLLFRLVAISRRRFPWLLLALALSARTLYLCVHLWQSLAEGSAPNLLIEGLGLAVSALFLAGVCLVRTAVCGEERERSDIDLLRRMQEENETFLHGVTHDLRTPLTVILGHAEMLQGEIERARLGELSSLHVGAIQTAGLQIDRMMDDLVDLARLGGGEIDLHCRMVELGSFVADFLARSAPALDVGRIEVHIPPDLPEIFADPRYLERSLVNLLSNALKYSEAPAPVTIRAERRGEEVLVSVTDRGRGIAPEDQCHVFSRFYRARNAGKKRGLGLGLFITRSFVEAHGGRIWVRSAPGEGSTFSFSIPIFQVTDTRRDID